ncbi:sulfite exporter TauE/SafE family protein [Devosia aurantiaca]|uniref:sulfite exporter TauE/SafE family protein n=1 Tax=Devosia aurantiaca TaxID=2714858 RepID=UPI001A99ABA8|nr:sulfite exporter TauE/SafE family protein [Devosia aurantiaca]
MTEILLFVAGLLGGAVNSLAGGGSFIVFPALLFAGVPAVLANASNTYAALPGYASGAFGYREAIARHKDKLIVYGIVAAVFGYAGAELLLVVSDEQFARVVPWLMTFAVALFIFGNQINSLVKSRGVRVAACRRSAPYCCWRRWRRSASMAGSSMQAWASCCWPFWRWPE